MKTLLIPIDLTPTNYNAIAFAAEWCKKYGYERIVLSKTFYDVFDRVVMSAVFVEQDYQREQRNDAEQQIETIKLQLETDTGCKIIIDYSEETLLRSIVEAIADYDPDMLVLGSDNQSHTSDSFIAGNIIGIAKISSARVMIVPAGYTYQPVQTALLPANFNTLEDMDKIKSLKTSPMWATTKLQVLYVDAKERYKTPDEKFKTEAENLHQYLEHFDHEIVYSNDKDIITGILNFTQAHQVQLIIAMPGRHSFLYSLTHKSISHAIYLNAKEPVMILK